MTAIPCAFAKLKDVEATVTDANVFNGTGGLPKSNANSRLTFVVVSSYVGALFLFVVGAVKGVPWVAIPAAYLLATASAGLVWRLSKAVTQTAKWPANKADVRDLDGSLRGADPYTEIRAMSQDLNETRGYVKESPVLGSGSESVSVGASIDG
jgi:hypothetical protein